MFVYQINCRLSEVVKEKSVNCAQKRTSSPVFLILRYIVEASTPNNVDFVRGVGGS